MKYGFVLPYGDARTAANLAREAEAAGWDGFFVWEPIWGIDPWVALTAAAMQTERIRLGTLLTPLSIRKPWKLASETATLDNLSGGRVILSIGLGAVDTGFERFGETTERKVRAELVDEGLEILNGLWHGQPFSFEGKHYHIQPTDFYPPPRPVQQPRIPIWMVGAWPSQKSMARVLRCDGILPNKLEPKANGQNRIGDITPEDIRAIQAFVSERRSAETPFDIVQEGKTPGDDAQKAAEIVRPWAEAGATWWIEAAWGEEDPNKLIERLRQGPPRL